MFPHLVLLRFDFVHIIRGLIALVQKSFVAQGPVNHSRRYEYLKHHNLPKNSQNNTKQDSTMGTVWGFFYEKTLNPEHAYDKGTLLRNTYKCRSVTIACMEN